MEEHKEAMDFDIEETTANNNSNTTMSSTSRPPYQRSNSTISTNQNESQQSWVSGGDSTSVSSDLTSGQLSASTINNSTYSGTDSSMPPSFMTPVSCRYYIFLNHLTSSMLIILTCSIFELVEDFTLLSIK